MAVERATLTMVCRVVSMLFSREFPVFPTGFRSLMFPRSPEQAKDYASKMIGAKLITKQTGAGGRVCNAVRFPYL